MAQPAAVKWASDDQVEQHSVSATVAYHLLPGVVILVVAIVFVPIAKLSVFRRSLACSLACCSGCLSNWDICSGSVGSAMGGCHWRKWWFIGTGCRGGSIRC